MEITLAIFRTIKTGNWFEAIWPKRPLSEFKKEAFVLFEGLLLKIKNDLIKFLLNLNLVVSNELSKKEKKKKFKTAHQKKKSAEMKNVLVVQEKNLNTATEIFKF